MHPSHPWPARSGSGHARAPGHCARTRAAAAGSSRDRSSSVTSSTTSCRIRASRRSLLIAAKTGHLGPTVFRSTDRGRTLEGGRAAAGFPQGRRRRGGPRGRCGVLAHARARQRARHVVRGHLARGSVPHRGRRRTLGAGRGLERPSDAARRGRCRPGTPDGPMLHSILVDPRDPRHLYLGCRAAACSSRTDGGARLAAAQRRLRGRLHPRAGPGVRPRSALRRAAPAAARPALPAEPLRHLPPRPAGDALGAHRRGTCRRRSATSASRSSLHPRDPDTAWVFPMDGTDRLAAHSSVGGKPAVYGTRDAGKSAGSRHDQRPAARAGLVHREASGDLRRRAASRSACTSARPAARCGRAPTRARRGAGSRATCRRSTRSPTRRSRGVVSCSVRDRESRCARTPTGVATVQADGATVRELLADLDRRYPGIRFRMIDEQDRIRPHIRLFVNTAAVESLGRCRCGAGDDAAPHLRAERRLSRGALAGRTRALPAAPLARGGRRRRPGEAQGRARARGRRRRARLARRRCTSRPPASARSASWTATASRSRTCSARCCSTATTSRGRRPRRHGSGCSRSIPRSRSSRTTSSCAPPTCARCSAATTSILDGTDRLATRYLVNDACVLLGKPLVSAAIHRFEGQVMTYVPGRGPCYRCLYADVPEGLVPNCADAGVLGVLPGVLGAVQATEAIKLVLGVGELLVGRLLVYDALEMRFHEFAFPRRMDCAVCGDHATITEPRDPPQACDAATLARVRHLAPVELHALLEAGPIARNRRARTARVRGQSPARGGEHPAWRATRSARRNSSGRRAGVRLPQRRKEPAGLRFGDGGRRRRCVQPGRRDACLGGDGRSIVRGRTGLSARLLVQFPARSAVSVSAQHFSRAD